MAYEPSGLSPFENAFVSAYVDNGGNGLAAHRTARSKARGAERRVEIDDLLGDPRIKSAIAAFERRARTVIDAQADKFAISKERILQELAKIAFADVRKVCEWTDSDGVRVKASSEIADEDVPLIAGITERTSAGGERRVELKTVSVADRRQALMDIAELLGFAAEKKIRLIQGMEDLTQEELMALARGSGGVTH